MQHRPLLSKHFIWALLFLFLVSFASGCIHKPEVPIRKAIWVTRWDYKTEQDIVDLMENIDKAGFDTVLFQVRGNATVFYPSALEPWAEEFDHKDPGFDPLEAACREARVRELQLHAWINAIPGWRGITAPPSTTPEQLWNSQPQWFLHSADGERQPLQPSYYVALNPSYPEVRDHVAKVCEEILTWYPEVVGIHLDYIRFLESGIEKDYPRDERSEKFFTADTGIESPDDDRRSWDEWRRDQVTEMVQVITERCREVRREVLMTAAVYRTPQIAHERVRQDWPNWLRKGYIDAVFPMQYDREIPRFESRVGECMDAARGYPVIMGLGTYLHADPAVTVAQEQSALIQGCQGVSHFAYSSFWSSDPNVAETPLQQKRRAQLLQETR